jgi:DNA-binding XRE family transcriptional regulator
LRSVDLKSPIAGADQGRDSGRADAGREDSVAGNNVRRIREALMMSKAELARKSGLSTLTIDRVEAGKACRLDTKRKILHALGLKVSEKDGVFGEGAVDEILAQCSAHHYPSNG